MRKNILCITQASCGGAERMVVLYAKILSNGGQNVQLLIHKSIRSKNFIKDFIPRQIHSHYLSSYSKFTPILVYLKVLQIRPDIVFAPLGDISWFLLRMKKYGIIKSKIIVREINMPNTHDKQLLLNNSKYCHYADLIIAQTQEMKDMMLNYYGVSDDKVVVINNPTDKDLIKEKIAEPFSLDNNYTNYVAVGRVVKQKDYMTMLKAFNIIHLKNINTRLYIIGRIVSDSPKSCYNELMDYIRSHSLSNSVFFEGFQSNPYKYVVNANVFLLSSLYEGLPNVMVEAMYLGRPIVATRCIPYIGQVIKDGINGYTCNVGDYQSFADCMVKASDINNLPMFYEVNQTDNKIIEVFTTL